MIQIRLDAGEQPVKAVFAQHKGGERRAWTDVPRRAPTRRRLRRARLARVLLHAPASTGPARGGTTPTARARRRARARRPRRHAARLGALAGILGRHEGHGVPMTPRARSAPGRHAQWRDPARSCRARRPGRRRGAPPPRPPAAPKIAVRATDGTLVVATSGPARPRGSSSPSARRAPGARDHTRWRSTADAGSRGAARRRRARTRSPRHRGAERRGVGEHPPAPGEDWRRAGARFLAGGGAMGA